MNNPQIKTKALIGVATLLLAGAGAALAQTSDLTLDSFDSGTQGSAPSGVGIWYGSCTATWDGTQDNTGNGGGSLYITSLDDNTSDTPLNPYICMSGGNPWYLASSVDLSQYKSVDFDIKWDNSSAITVDEFDNVATWPAIFGTPVGQFDGDPYSYGFNIKAVTGGNGTFIQLGYTNIPTSASNGWVHVSFPINASTPGISVCNGIDLEKWDNNSGSIVGEPTAKFWIDNIVLKGTAGPPPPPKMNNLTAATPGLAVFASTEGNSFYDRQDAELKQSSGLSWIGQATPSTPVTYSFTIAGYPNSVNCEAWFFLIPNPASATDNGPDWNETNAAIFYLQGNSSSATAHFQIKVNEDHQQQMYSGGTETRVFPNSTNNYSFTNAPGSLPGGTVTNVVSSGVYDIQSESGSLVTVANPGVLGTWTVKFTSATAGMIITPNGTTASFNIEPYFASYFAETASPAFSVYLGMQANNADAMNQAVVYSNFAVSNSASPFYENFQADTVLDTTNTWITSGAAAGPKGVLIVPANASYWLTWTLPDSGFSLQAAPTLGNPLAWNPASTFPGFLPLYDLDAQLLATNDMPAGPVAFFDLIKRTPTQLQVLWPGETNAPNTTTGKIGTPQTGFTPTTPVTVTINMVDSTFHIVNSSDAVYETSSDSQALFNTGPALSLVGGTVTDQVYFSAAGTPTETVTDTSNTNILSGTSSPITISQ